MRVLIFGAAAILAWHSWGRWGDFEVDCGRDLYLSLEILRGKLLYRDLWYPYGPLTPYIDALLVRVFGQHLTVFYLFGIAATVACALVAFQIGEELREPGAGIAAALLVIFQGFEPSLFSYVSPYTYAAPLGLLFSLLTALFTIRHLLEPTGQWLLLAGFGAGLALLCKQEFGAACWALLAIALVGNALIQGSWRPLITGILKCTPGAAFCLAIYGWFFWKLGPSFIAFDNWQLLPGSYFMRVYGPRYMHSLGLRFVPSELAILILDGGTALALWYEIARLRDKYTGLAPTFVGILLLLALAALLRYSVSAPQVARLSCALLIFPSGMFFIGAGFLAVTSLKFRRGDNCSTVLAEAAFAAFALLLSVRILARVEPVGFAIYYDVPLFTVLVVCISRSGRLAAQSPERANWIVRTLIAVEAVLLASTLVPLFNNPLVELRTNWGGIYLSPADAKIARGVLDFLSAQKREGRKVVVMPEGHMLYALSGTEAPSRWETVIPGILAPEQEKNYIADLKRANPGFILMTNRTTAEYGAPFFGIDYDRELYAWIEQNYRVTGEFGHFRRDRSQGWAALIYQRMSQNPGS